MRQVPVVLMVITLCLMAGCRNGVSPTRPSSLSSGPSSSIRKGMGVSDATKVMQDTGAEQDAIPLEPPPGLQYLYFTLRNGDSLLLYHDGSTIKSMMLNEESVEEYTIK